MLSLASVIPLALIMASFLWKSSSSSARVVFYRTYASLPYFTGRLAATLKLIPVGETKVKVMNQSAAVAVLSKCFGGLIVNDLGLPLAVQQIG